MTSQWAQWRLKSPASLLFIEPFIQGADQRKHQSSASLAFVREFSGGRWIPRTWQMASNAENVSTWWRHHDVFVTGRQINSLVVLIKASSAVFHKAGMILLLLCLLWFYTVSVRIHKIYLIRVASHQHHGVSNYLWLDCLINILSLQ